MGNILLKKYVESNYFVLFDKIKGVFIRVGMGDCEPFYNFNGPELLDISITNYCERDCSFCYRASDRLGKSIALDEYKMIMEQAEKVGVLQVALGGGNPNQHPDFISILNVTRAHNIIPSYTTNGQGMTDDIYNATKHLCGAIAVSWYYPYADARQVIEKCAQYGIKCNIHFLLDNLSIREAIIFLQREKVLLKKINAIIFLTYKPIHSGIEKCLKDNSDLIDFFNTVQKVSECKIGFDSCMISYLTLIGSNLVAETVEYCEAGRFSGFISENLILYPCSFMNDLQIAGVDLRTNSLESGWRNGSEFLEIRKRLKTPGTQEYPIKICAECNYFGMCHGGCPILPINRCK